MDSEKIRAQFPLINNEKIVYLDNAATTQKPQKVIDALAEFYTKRNANPMRGMYDLSLLATESYEEARRKTADFINAKKSSEIIYTRNATESLNLAASIAAEYLGEGDEVLVSTSEHHSNFLPWKKICERTGAKVRYLDCQKDGTISENDLKKALSPNTKLFTVACISNVFGRINPVLEYAEICHKNNTLICVDAAQSVAHIPTDVTESDVDFLAFSGHKMYGPFGTGVLYAKEELLEKAPPFLEGGEMIEYVSKDRVVYADPPHRFEAGTVSAADAYALSAAIDFINETGFDNIRKIERELTDYAFEGMCKTEGVEIIGSCKSEEHNGILTFTLKDVHPHDIAEIFARSNICVRAGHHCAEPLHILLGIPSTVRLSLAVYNTKEDIDAFLEVLANIRSMMGY